MTITEFPNEKDQESTSSEGTSSIEPTHKVNSGTLVDSPVQELQQNSTEANLGPIESDHGTLEGYNCHYN